MWVAKLLTFFQQNNSAYICVSLDVNFNESLTNDVVSFEQLGPEKVIGGHKISSYFILYSILCKKQFFTKRTFMGARCT